MSADEGTSVNRWPLLATVALGLGIIASLGLNPSVAGNASGYTGRKPDYYNRLVHGFLEGHLYMDMGPDSPLNSGDPAVIAKVGTPLDSSLYKGRFYLYFGVVPAALFLLPYSLLTGGDLDSGLIVAPSIMAGFLFLLGTWRMLVRDLRLRLPPLFEAAAASALALATATQQLLTRQMFYEIAIASGFAFVAAGAFWIYRAISGRGRAWLELAIASACLGLSVGCRPDLVVTLPGLAAAAFAVGCGRRQGNRCGTGLAGALAAAAIPAALVGGALAAYNYARFGSIFEFGFKYGQNKFLGNSDPFAKLGFLLWHIKWDYLTLPTLSPYFPYVLPESASFRPKGFYGDEVLHGQFAFFLLAAFVALTAIVVRRPLRLGRAAVYLPVVGWMFLAPFVALGCLGVRADRYAADFHPMLVLGTVVLASCIVPALAAGTGARLWTTAFAVLAFASCALNVFAGIQEFDALSLIRPKLYHELERAGNYPSYLLCRLGLIQSGPVAFSVVFPSGVARAKTEPLVTVGTSDRSDSVYVIQHEDNRIEILAGHRGTQDRRSAFIPITPGKTYRFEVDMGALYPPLNHPYFDSYGKFQALVVKTRLKVWIDGRLTMNNKMSSFDAPPWALEFGRNDVTLTAYGTRFSGEISHIERLRPPPPSAFHPADGLWKIHCDLPMQMVGMRYPVLSLGISGSGTLLYMTILPDSRINFCMDEWGYGGGSSKPIPVKDGWNHGIEVFVGPLVDQADWKQEWGLSKRGMDGNASTLRVWLDGSPVFTTALNSKPDPLDPFADIGTNLQGFSTAEESFYGDIGQAPFSEVEAREFLLRNLSEKR